MPKGLRSPENEAGLTKACKNKVKLQQEAAHVQSAAWQIQGLTRLVAGISGSSSLTSAFLVTAFLGFTNWGTNLPTELCKPDTQEQRRKNRVLEKATPTSSCLVASDPLRPPRPAHSFPPAM
jgi:hypothetical protein